MDNSLESYKNSICDLFRRRYKRSPSSIKSRKFILGFLSEYALYNGSPISMSRNVIKKITANGTIFRRLISKADKINISIGFNSKQYWFSKIAKGIILENKFFNKYSMTHSKTGKLNCALSTGGLQGHRVAAKNMLGLFCRRQKRGLFSPVFAFLKEHSRGYVTEKRRKPAKKEPFLTR